MAITLLNLVHGPIIFEQNLPEFVLFSHLSLHRSILGALSESIPASFGTFTGLLNLFLHNPLVRQLPNFYQILLEQVVVSFCDCAIVLFDSIDDLGEILLVISDRSNHLEIVLEVLDLLVEDHEIYHYPRVFESLNILLVFPNIFWVPLQDPVDVELAHAAFELLDEPPDGRNVLFCNARPLLLGRPVEPLDLRPLPRLLLLRLQVPHLRAEGHSRGIFGVGPDARRRLVRLRGFARAGPVCIVAAVLALGAGRRLAEVAQADEVLFLHKFVAAHVKVGQLQILEDHARLDELDLLRRHRAPVLHFTEIGQLLFLQQPQRLLELDFF